MKTIKRLIKKCNQNDELINTETGLPMIDVEMVQRLRNEVIEDIQNVNTSNMILLNQLDEADVRHDKCPKCKYEPMKRKEGFKICPSCGMIYKVLNGNGYAIMG